MGGKLRDIRVLRVLRVLAKGIRWWKTRLHQQEREVHREGVTFSVTIVPLYRQPRHWRG